MKLTEENIVTMIEAVRERYLEWDKYAEALAKKFKAASPKEKKIIERAKAVAKGDTVDFKTPSWMLKKGAEKVTDLPFLLLTRQGFGYDEETGMIRKPWLDTLKAELDTLRVLSLDNPFFKAAYKSASKLSSKKNWEKYLEENEPKD